MQSQDYCLLEYALQEQDLHPVWCKGMMIPPPSAAIKSKQRFWTSARILSAAFTIDGWPGAWSDDLAPPQGLGVP